MAEPEKSRNTEMADRIFTEIQRVFGLSLEDSQLLFNSLSEGAGLRPTEFYLDLMKKFPKPTQVEFPLRPANEASLNIYREKLRRFQETVPTNNTLFVNEGNNVLNNEGRPKHPVSRGEFGYVKHNRKGQYVYKYMRYSMIAESQPAIVKAVLIEPLINCILQADPIAKPYICQIHRVFCVEEGASMQLIFKLERLGPTLEDGFVKRFTGVGTKKDYSGLLNYAFMNIFGQLFESLTYLAKIYKFSHNDLHGNNLLFGNTFTPRLRPPPPPENLKLKLIDFGLSELAVLGKRFNARFEKSLGGTTAEEIAAESAKQIFGSGSEYSNPSTVETEILKAYASQKGLPKGGKRRRTSKRATRRLTRKQKRKN